MIVGVPTRSLSIEENLKILKRIGFDGFQFDLSSCGIDTLKKGFLLDEEEDKCVKNIKKLSDELEFPVLALHTFYPLNVDENVVIKTFEKNLEYLKSLNCRYLILHISGYCDDKERLNQAINCLKELEYLYKKSGCEILLENDHKPSLFITIKDIEKVNAKLNFNLCFDTTHAMQSDVDIDEFWKHSISVGIAMNVLYEKVENPPKISKDILHLSGLMHGIGILTLVQYFFIKFVNFVSNF